VLVALCLMLIGADEISTIEAGAFAPFALSNTLTLYGADPKHGAVGLPAPFARAVTSIIALPGWAVLPLSRRLPELRPS